MNSLRQRPASHSSLIPRLLAQCSAPTKHPINTCWFSEQALVCARAPKERVYSASSKTSSWFMRNPPPLWCCSWDLVCFLLKFCWWVSRTFSPVFTGSSSLSLNLSSGEPAVTGLDFSLKGGLPFMFSSTKFEKAHSDFEGGSSVRSHLPPSAALHVSSWYVCFSDRVFFWSFWDMWSFWCLTVPNPTHA